MLVLSILFTAIAVSLMASHLTSIHFTRCTVIVMLFCWLLVPSLTFDYGCFGIYHSLFSSSIYQNVIDNILYLVAIVILISINPILVQAYGDGSGMTRFNVETSNQNVLNFVVKPELSILVQFIILGSTILLCSFDLLSVYLTLELQSFALYLVASLRTDLISSTGAGLKYFLLGAMSSAFFILGASLIYQVLGTTNFQVLSTLMVSMNSGDVGLQTIYLGMLLILCGLIFKISAAPFHNWFADVIQDVPTFIGMIIMNIPKISVLTLLYYWTNHVMILRSSDQLMTPTGMLIMIVIVMSLILGTVAGLVQTKLKRLLAFSTISHVGFMLMSFLVVGVEGNNNYMLGMESLTFYLMQYLVTILLTIMILTAYETAYFKRSINNLSDLISLFQPFPVLTFTLILCLFSIAGIPPLTGFFAKYNVLKCSLVSSSYFVAFLAIMCSLISASYYMKLIKLTVFEGTEGESREGDGNINPVMAYAMSVLVIIMVLYIFDTALIINSIELMAWSFLEG